MGPLQGGERGREPGDGAKEKTSLDWDSVSSLQSPVSANHMGSSVIFLDCNFRKGGGGRTKILLKEIAKVLVKMHSGF